MADLSTPSMGTVEHALAHARPTARSAVAVPFVLRGRLLGAAELLLPGVERLTASARDALTTLAGFVGVVLGEAVAHGFANEATSRVERAQKAQAALVHTLSVLPEQQLQTAVRRGFYVWPQSLETSVPEFIASVIQKVADEARVLVGAEIAAIGIGDLAERSFSPWAISGVSEGAVAAIGRTPRPVGTLGLPAIRGETVRVRDVRKHPSFRGLPAGHPAVKSLLGVPIRYRGRSLGNLYLGNKIGAGEFSAEDQRAAEALASQAAIALQQGFLQASIETQRAQTQGLLDSAPHGILFVDAQTRHVMANPSAMRLLGETVTPAAGIEQYIERFRFPDGRSFRSKRRPRSERCKARSSPPSNSSSRVATAPRSRSSRARRPSAGSAASSSAPSSTSRTSPRCVTSSTCATSIALDRSSTR